MGNRCSLEESEVILQLGDVRDVAGTGDGRALEGHLQVVQCRVDVVIAVLRVVQRVVEVWLLLAALKLRL